MNCKQVKNNLIFYYYGELDEKLLRQIQNHLEHCEACRVEYNKLALALDYAELESQLKAPDDMWENINSKINSVEKQRTNVLWLRAVQTIAAAALIALAIFIGSLVGRSYVQQFYPVTTAQVNYDDYDSLVQAFTSFDENVYLVLDK